MTDTAKHSPQYPSPETHLMGGWIVGSGDGKRFRYWSEGFPAWTPDRLKATRYARREDAESVHQEDEDAWSVQQFSPAPTPEPQMVGFSAASELFDWIILHKASVLDGMTRREQADFTEVLGKARAALAAEGPQQ